MHTGTRLAPASDPGEAAAMRRYTFRALVILRQATREGAGQRDLGGARVCLVEPCHCTYFPAMVSPEEEVPPRATALALVTIALHDGEAGAFFAPGRCFTIWADAIVGSSIKAAGEIGHGIISQRVSPSGPRAFRGKAAGWAAGPAHPQVPGSSSPVGRAYRDQRRSPEIFG
jgi:hypothetical protein